MLRKRVTQVAMVAVLGMGSTGLVSAAGMHGGMMSQQSDESEQTYAHGYGPGGGYGPRYGYGMMGPGAGYGYGGQMGPGMMMGPGGGYGGGYGMMGPGMMMGPGGGYGGGYGSGMMGPGGGYGGGYGPGMMGPGMMMGPGGGYGHGMMGPGMMRGMMGMMGPGMMMGPGSGYGPGMMGQGMMGPGAGYGPRGWDLSEEQQEKVRSIQQKNHKKQLGLMADMQRQQAKLYELNAKSDPDEEAIREAYEELGEIQRKMMENRVQARKQMHEAMSDE